MTFNITTTAPTARRGSPFSRRGGVFYALLVPGLLGILITAGQRKPSARGMRLLGLIATSGGTNPISNSTQVTLIVQ